MNIQISFIVIDTEVPKGTTTHLVTRPQPNEIMYRNATANIY